MECGRLFFFSPSMWEEVAVMSYAGKSTNLGHVWLFLFLMACGRLIGYLSFR